MLYRKNLYSINELILYSVGRQHCEPKHNYSTSFKDRYLIHFVISGKGRVRCVDGKEYKLSRGNAFLIGNKECYYEADDIEPWTYIWIHVSGEELRELLDTIDVNTDNPIFTSTAPEKISGCCEELYMKFYRQENMYSLMKSLFELLEIMIETGVHKNESKIYYENEYVELCKKYIFENYEKKINADILSREVGIEYSYLFRLFKEYVGVAPILFAINYKMIKAAEMIEKYDLNINEAATRVGYEDRALFSKIFKKYIGMSPQKYKNRLKNKSI